MFYYLRGTLAMLQADFAVVDCGGVGYRLSVSASTVGTLAAKLQSEVLLYTHFAVREDSAELYGFATEEELSLFRRLISVSGVGPKAAMSILSTLSPQALVCACADGDYKALTRAPGVGSKLAQRILLELKDKLADGLPASGTEGPSGSAGSAGSSLSQVIDTLTLYGFTREQIRDAARSLDLSQPLETLIAETLRILASKQ